MPCAPSRHYKAESSSAYLMELTVCPRAQANDCRYWRGSPEAAGWRTAHLPEEKGKPLRGSLFINIFPPALLR